MSPAANSLSAALCEVRAGVARGDVRLQEFAQGRPGDLAVPSRDHLFVVRPSRLSVRAIARRDERRIAFLDTVARSGAVMLVVVWVLTALALLRGEHQVPALLMGGASALLFVVPVLVSHIITSDAVAVDDDHPLACEAASALRDALAEARPQLPRSIEARPSSSAVAAPSRRTA